MNFYKHHLGDYDSATMHLTWNEDMAYTRLLRVYYRAEKPIPSDMKSAWRLVRATSKQERDAVESVLREFFELREDGWHQARADEEICLANERAEKNRAVGKLGGRPRKNDNHKETQTVSETKPTENPDGFKTKPTENPSQTPDSRLQTKTPGTNHSLQDSTVVGADNPPRNVETTRAGEIAFLVRQHGVSATPGNPHVQAWANGFGATDDELREAIARAREQKPESEKIPVKYLDAILRNMRAERQSPLGQAPPRPTKATVAAINARSIFKPEDSHERTIDSTASRISDHPSQVG